MTLAADDGDVVIDLLVDRLIKGGIVLAALVVVVVALTIVYRRTGPKDPR
ncbi:hypothetical protein [Actinomadura citrea]|uniref:Uncharacterized protein n=1 Tax=Actinomadura citrea TaxID=46158 RepID=A0A7Y9GF23_9ACTN|nr:hypothetical protein [Actinomadura citrea]NYE15342.1 hypothetical protein [Actinomadura citrea]